MKPNASPEIKNCYIAWLDTLYLSMQGNFIKDRYWKIEETN